jgi:soluble lytic murein transglycosylase
MLKKCAIAALLILTCTFADAGTSATQAPGAHSLSPTLVPPELRVLAARADTRPGWGPLARYAESARDHEVKGLAYLALGYREYQAAAYAPALDHLERAAATGFSLAEYAEYYRAAAAQQAGKPDVAAHALADFRDRFPRSVLGIAATRLLAFCRIQAGQSEEAIHVLEAEPSVHKQPPLEYLLGQAYEKAGQLAEAARALQDVYYQFATSPEAAAPSATLLKSIQLRLGASYPAPSEELRATRAGALEKVGRLEAALDEYQALLKDDPNAASSFTWRLGRDRCLIALGRTGEALADLSADGWPAGDVDAERILLLVRAHSRARDESGMLAALDQMAHLHAGSSDYAAALDSASFFFLRQVDWARASTFGKTLAESYPNSELAEKAEWEVAWAAYLAGDNAEARRRLLAYAGHYPASFRIPAALYWLGRVDEAAHQTDGACSVYKLLRQRYRNNYYSLRAAERMQGLAASVSTHTTSVASPASEDTSLPPEIRAIAERAGSAADHAADQARLCGQPSSAAERPALTLTALGLTDLAEHDLRLRLQNAAGSDESSDLRLALARIEREREEYEPATYHTKRVVPYYPSVDFDALPAEIWSLLYPEAFWDLVRRNADANHLDPYLVMALIRQESGFDPKAVSGPGARGLMQLLPPTAKELARGPRSSGGHRRASGNLFDPDYNLRVGCRFFSEMIREFHGSLEQALAAYNAGPDRLKQWLNGHSFSEPAAFVESIPFPETRTYVQTVLRDQVVYRQLMTGKPRFKACGSRS